MMFIIKLLNDMATSHPQETALTEQGHTISFAGLKHLVDTISQQLCDDGVGIYGQYIENKTSGRIFALCAEHIGIFSKLINIPTAITKEGLSSTLKTAHIHVLYTDVMDKLLDTTNTLGPFIAMVTPIEFYNRKIWKVRFRSNRSSPQINLDEINSRHRLWQVSSRKKEIYA